MEASFKKSARLLLDLSEAIFEETRPEVMRCDCFEPSREVERCLYLLHMKVDMNEGL